jgi:hypothetical protein
MLTPTEKKANPKTKHSKFRGKMLKSAAKEPSLFEAKKCTSAAS